jgi:hypothetical protein
MTADLRRLHVTVTRSFVQKLKSAKSALSHSHPHGSIAEILEAGLDLLLQRDARRKGLVKNPRPPSVRRDRKAVGESEQTLGDDEPRPNEQRPNEAGRNLAAPQDGGPAPVPGRAQAETPGNTPCAAPSATPSAASSAAAATKGPDPAPDRKTRRERIPAHVRRAVWLRDQGRCQWPLESGGICGSTTQLELDHILPLALGGTSTIENTRVGCKPHNLHAARLAFGTAFMERFSRFSTRNRAASTAAPSTRPFAGPHPGSAADPTTIAPMDGAVRRPRRASG